MTIEIVGKGKNKQLFVDGVAFCIINDFIILKYKLRSGAILDKDKLDEIKNESELELGFSLAVDFVARGARTNRQVAEFLNKKISKVNAELVLEKMQSYRYIDDEAYTKNFYESKKNSMGINKIKLQLAQKGINRQVVDRVLAGSKLDGSVANVVAKKYMKNKEPTPQNLAKLNRYLLNKGFSWEEIRQIDWIHKENDDESWD